ncbi:MAG: hypothetical protein PHQ66_02735 [Candidatus Nanoarchaeia archaeon]|nr:hypothetical protein [Candidatus Nanoarchaeia archaeon]MDD5357718.1 hypothetical protein [Candidatus Nanoarchaeia archaeon]MDD5588637.1 hypothetical protein [Candidatus Nanoarchaeia archaeon]
MRNIQNLIEEDRMKIPFDNADFMDSTEREIIESKIGKISWEEIKKKSGFSNIKIKKVIEPSEKNPYEFTRMMTMELTCIAGGYLIGDGINKEYGGLIGAVVFGAVNGFCEYQLHKKRQGL